MACRARGTRLMVTIDDLIGHDSQSFHNRSSTASMDLSN